MADFRPKTSKELEEERVIALLDNRAFLDTVKSWIDSDIDAATVEMASEDDPIKNAKARGKYLALTAITARLEAVAKRSARRSQAAEIFDLNKGPRP